MWANGQEIFLFETNKGWPEYVIGRRRTVDHYIIIIIITTNTKIHGGFTIQNSIMDPIHG
jgi:hypothetical protein